jgi:hypothetical protein
MQTISSQQLQRLAEQEQAIRNASVEELKNDIRAFCRNWGIPEMESGSLLQAYVACSVDPRRWKSVYQSLGIGNADELVANAKLVGGVMGDPTTNYAGRRIDPSMWSALFLGATLSKPCDMFTDFLRHTPSITRDLDQGRQLLVFFSRAAPNISEILRSTTAIPPRMRGMLNVAISTCVADKELSSFANECERGRWQPGDVATVLSSVQFPLKSEWSWKDFRPENAEDVLVGARPGMFRRSKDVETSGVVKKVPQTQAATPLAVGASGESFFFPSV